MPSHKEEHHLTDLFPYDPSKRIGSELEKSLKEYQFLLLVALAAIESFQNIDLEKFDCVVGENACQIRAIRIALIASQDQSVFSEFNQKITASLTKIDELLSPETLQTSMRDRNSLKDLIDKHDLDITLNSDEIFLIKSYILSEMKETDSNDEFVRNITRKDICVPDKLKEKHPEISTRFLSLLAKNLRSKVSKASVCFVNSAASDLADPTLTEMLSDHTLEHNDLLCTPTFWTFKTLLLLAQKKRLPLIVHVKFLNHLGIGYHVIDEEYLVYKPCEHSESYILSELTKEDLHQPACFIEGIICPKAGQPPISKAEWIKSMNKNSIVDVLLAFAADHRQYPDPEKTVPVHDKEYEYYKKLAESEGFSLNNPTTFFARHMYCSQINKKYHPQLLSRI